MPNKKKAAPKQAKKDSLLPKKESPKADNTPTDMAPKKKDKSSIWLSLVVVGFFILLILLPTVILPALEGKDPSSTGPNGTFVGIDDYAAKEGYLAPLFQLTDSEGQSFNLESFRGDKPVVLIFETTGCGYCRRESPAVEALRTKYGDQVEFASLDIGESADTVNSYRSQNDIARRWLLDSAKSVASLYSSYSTPSHFFINEDGYIEDLWIGYLEQNDLERYVKELL